MQLPPACKDLLFTSGPYVLFISEIRNIIDLFLSNKNIILLLWSITQDTNHAPSTTASQQQPTPPTVFLLHLLIFRWP